jgi:clan AA aspartic protease (TIGR02281 family)
MLMPNIIAPLFVIAALLSLSFSASGDGMIYKCKNQQGDLIYQKSPCNEAVQAISSWSAKAKQPSSSVATTLIIEQSNTGHYFIAGAVNDTDVTFVVDTGASVMSLPSAVAQSADIPCRNHVKLNTANGVAKACTAMISKLTFGAFTLEDVEAVIVPNLAEVLLGMNVLQRFNMVQKGGEMRISAQN